MQATGAVGEFRAGSRPLLAATLGLALGIAGIPLYSFGYFVVPLMQEYALSRAQVSSWATVFTLTVMVCAPLVGLLADRVGTRSVAAASFAGLALAYVFAAFAPGGVVAVYASAVLIAGLGSGTLPVTFTKVVTSNFHRSRGLALGVALCGVLMGVTLASYVVPAALERGGLPRAYLALALIAAAGVPVAILGLRSRDPDRRRQVAETLGGASLKEAMTRPVFWLLSVSFFLFCLASTGVVIHLVPAMGERGIAPTATSILFVALSLGSLVGRLAIGFTVDRVFAPRILFAVFSLAAMSCLALVEAPFGWVLLSVALLGFAIGAEVDLIAFLAAGYFGLRHYGKVYGVLYTMFALGSAVGPPVVGWVRDASGDYVLPFIGCAAAMAAAASLFIAIGRHRFPSYDRPPPDESAGGTGLPNKG